MSDVTAWFGNVFTRPGVSVHERHDPRLRRLEGRTVLIASYIAFAALAVMIFGIVREIGRRRRAYAYTTIAMRRGL